MDEWMPYIAEMPRLGFLGVQGTLAGDAGFVALGRSSSIEHRDAVATTSNAALPSIVNLEAGLGIRDQGA